MGDTEETKVCVRCGETKPVTAFHRHRGKRRPDCGQCKAKRYQAERVAYREKHRERLAAEATARYWADPEKARARVAQQRKESPERKARQLALRERDELEAKGLRKCSSCNKVKDLEEEYSPHKQGRLGRAPRCKSCNAKTMAEYRERRMLEDPDGYRRARMAAVRKDRYGITQEDYDLLMEKQNGLCAICGSSSPRNGRKTFLAVDHNHDTGRIRGLLCDPCNNGIVRFGDDPELLVKAANYLTESSQ